MTLLRQISALKDFEPESRNLLNSFLPYRKGAKEFDFNAVGGVVLSSLTGQQVKGSLTFAKYKQICLDRLASKLSECLLYTSPSPRDLSTSRMPSSA